MKSFKDGMVMVGDNIVLLQGRSPSGKYGKWILNRWERISLNEPTFHFRKRSRKDLIKQIKAL